MRIAPSLAAVGLLVVVLTWLSLHAVNRSAAEDDRALAALGHFGMVDNALCSDVLLARIGLLRDYDPLVREVDALDRSLGLIRRSGPPDGRTEEAVDRLAAAVGGEERLVERFKTDNALLQNSLAYFGLFSGRLGGAAAGGGALAASVSRLAAAMLHFTLDTSPTTAAAVESELNRLAGEKPPGRDAHAMHVLLAHGRMLQALLPATDALLRALAASPIHADEDAVHSLILAHQAAARARAHRFRSVLYVLSLLLVGLLLHLGLSLQARAGALRRRAAFERMIAAFSVRLAQAAPREHNAAIAGALGEMADFLGAERAYLVLSGGAPRTIAWRKPGSSFPADWPERAPMLAAAMDPGREGVLHVRRAKDLFAGDEAALFRNAGLTGWACAWRAGQDGGHGLLGFDALRRPLRITQAGELNLLRVALDAIANAVGRQSLEEEREQLEAQVQQARRMETVGALASGIAHNFNNIIGAIMGHAEMAEAQAASEGRESGNIAAIRRAGQRAGELVEQILAFARPRDVPRTAISVATSVREAASLLRASLPPETALVIGALPEEAFVRAAPAQLQQVILNLCINASQAMQGRGSVTVEVRVQDLPAPRARSHGQLRQGRYACIAVTDRGPGIDSATLGRIFEPFVTTRADGNGLGLTTVREIVRAYGGAMHVESAPGAGSRFEAWLPCLASTAVGAAVGTTGGTAGGTGAATGPVPAPPLGHGDTLLVVNEDRAQLLRDEEILAALGYEPVGFANSEEALAACRAAPGRFRAAIVARVVPEEAATALAAALHRVLPSLPIVLVVPFSERVAAKALVGIGLSEVVSAPIAPAEIAFALAHTLAPPGESAARALPPSSE